MGEVIDFKRKREERSALLYSLRYYGSDSWGLRKPDDAPWTAEEVRQVIDDLRHVARKLHPIACEKEGVEADPVLFDVCIRKSGIFRYWWDDEELETKEQFEWLLRRLDRVKEEFNERFPGKT